MLNFISFYRNGSWYNWEKSSRKSPGKSGWLILQIWEAPVCSVSPQNKRISPTLSQHCPITALHLYSFAAFHQSVEKSLSQYLRGLLYTMVNIQQKWMVDSSLYSWKSTSWFWYHPAQTSRTFFRQTSTRTLWSTWGVWSQKILWAL